jgi:hypothetical protein
MPDTYCGKNNLKQKRVDDFEIETMMRKQL